MSSHPTPWLLDLAPELIENVIKQVGNRRDLSNLRLAAKALDEHAVKELFKNVYMSPEDTQNWTSISLDNTLRQLPRHAIIHTQSDLENEEPFQEHEEIPDEYNTALAALSRFPNLDSVEIGFTPNCLGQEAADWQECAEGVEQREHMLELIFTAIKDRAADEKNRTIRKLTIVNLQNCPLPDFTSSDLFRNVMGQLEELHIQLIQEYNEPGPDHDYTVVELRTFPKYFCSHWLEPISANLRALSIYSRRENWGPFPGYFDPSGISFPKLETLALGYYTIAHDNDINWILAIKSLRKLIMHNCMIASWIRIGTENMDIWRPPTHDWIKMTKGDDEEERSWCTHFSYNGKWSQHLDRIAEALPKLVDFRFDAGSRYYFDEGHHVYDLENSDSAATRMFPERYVPFDNGILPTHWSEAAEDGTMHSMDRFPKINLHVENLEADQKSLDALLHKLGQAKR